MACSNTSITRYRVRMKKERGDFGKTGAFLDGTYVFPNIIAVDGLNTGIPSTTKVTEQRGEIEMADGRIKGFDPLRLTFRTTRDLAGEIDRELIMALTQNLSNVVTVYVDVTDISFCPHVVYTFYGCTYGGAPHDGLSKAQPAVANIVLTLLPYDVQMTRPELQLVFR